MHEQNYFAVLDGKMDKSKISRTLKWLRSKGVIEAKSGSDFFLPPSQWRVSLRTAEGSRAVQLELEQWLDRAGQQSDLKLFELDAAVQEQFIAGPVVSETTEVVCRATSPVVCETTRVAPPTTEQGSHTNVYDKRGTERSTLNAPRRLEEKLMGDIRDYMQHWCPAAAEDEMINSGGFWRKLAFFYPDTLDAAIREMHDVGKRNGFTKGPREALTNCVKDFLFSKMGVNSFDQAWAVKPEKIRQWELRKKTSPH